VGGSFVSVKAAGGGMHTAVISAGVPHKVEHIEKRRKDIERQNKGKEITGN